VPNVPVVGGSVTATTTSQVRRSATLDVADPQYWPSNPLAVLSALGSELQVEYGIQIPGGPIEWVPVIRGVITDVSRARPATGSTAAFTATLADLSVKVAQMRFDQPVQTIAGATVVAEIRRLITEAVPGATVTDLTGSTQVAAQMEMERERWSDGVEKLADAIGAEVYADPVGRFIIRPQPVITNIPVWTVSTGHSGNVVTLDEKTTRDLTYNKVVASGQRVDGTPPVWAAVADTDPASPTWIGGPFGTKTRFYVSQLLTTGPQCTTAATALLARTIGMHGSLTMSLITNPALDCGDVLSLRDGDRTSNHIIDSLTVPLGPREAQQITTRSLELPPEV
jgi:hypothetical protein